MGAGQGSKKAPRNPTPTKEKEEKEED